MKFGYVKSATFTPELKVGDVDFNAQKIIDGIDEAYSRGVELLVLPKLSISGCTCSDLYFSKTLLRGATEGLLKIANSTKGKKILVFVGLPIEVDGKIFDACFGISDGTILGGVPKPQVCGMDDYFGARHFSSGKGVNTSVFLGSEQGAVPFCDGLIFRSQTGVKIAVEFLEENSCFQLENAFGAHIVVSPSAFIESVGMEEKVKEVVKTLSLTNACAIVLSSAGCGESTTDCVFSGKSYIAENGEILAQNLPFSLGLTVSDIDVENIEYARNKKGKLLNLQAPICVGFNLPEDTFLLDRTYSKTPFIVKNGQEYALTLQAQALKKRVAHTNAGAIVLGLSGGLDSTLALLVAVRAIKLLNRPTKDVVAVTMPCFGTTSRTLDNSILLAKTLGVTLKKIDISKTVTRHLKDIKHDFALDVAFENAQARERTQVLMDLANMNNGLVLGTGDLSEMALGWATYNGDHMSMYAVNGSIPKTLVRDLVNYSASVSKGKLKAVLLDILDTPVSPELLPAKDDQIQQVTEDIVGPYVLHDFFIYHFVESGFTPKKLFYIAKTTFDGYFSAQTILKWLKVFFRRFFSQQFKRSCVPDGVKVTKISLSPRTGLKMPSDAVCALWQKELEDISI